MDPTGRTFTPEELDFSAQHEHIRIVPLIKLPQLNFIQGTYGPFQPPREATVPLWLAMYMRKSNQCRVLPPPWMTAGMLLRVARFHYYAGLNDVDKLQAMVKVERSQSEFAQVPAHYLELCKNLLEWAREDLQESHTIRSLVMELCELRR